MEVESLDNVPHTTVTTVAFELPWRGGWLVPEGVGDVRGKGGDSSSHDSGWIARSQVQFPVLLLKRGIFDEMLSIILACPKGNRSTGPNKINLPSQIGAVFTQ